jgi:predicted NUDIX family phosphoesterase
MTQINIVQQQRNTSYDEYILVVRRAYLFSDILQPWHGLKEVDFEHYLHIINHKKEFHPRLIMETDPTYKQIIPYLIFEHNNNYFLMQRQSTASETRLRNKVTLGIGGHIRKEDMSYSAEASSSAKASEDKSKDMQENSLFAWARREFHEEVNYSGNLVVTPLGILNDDSDDVGKVHIGFVFLLTGDVSDITVKSELKSGMLVPLSECLAQRDRMESWSQFVVDFLQNRIME